MTCENCHKSDLLESESPISFQLVRGGVHTYKMGMTYVPPDVKKKGAYGADKTEKV